MPPELKDVLRTAREFAELLELSASTSANSLIHDEALESGKRLYRMMRHIPGIHNHGDAPERQS